MGKFKQSFVTTAGKKVLFGGGDVTYTRAILFSQDVSAMSEDQLKALTALSGQLMDASLKVAENGDSNVKVEATFSNANLKDDINFKSVGWFAKAGKGTETLIAVSPIEGVKTLGAGSPDKSTDAITLKLNMAIGDSTKVNVVIDPAGAVSRADLDSAVGQIKSILNLQIPNMNAPVIDDKFDINQPFEGWRKFWGSKPQGLPDDFSAWGYVYEFQMSPANSNIQFAVSVGRYDENKLAYRMKGGNQWTDWKELVDQASLQTSIDHYKELAFKALAEIRNELSEKNNQTDFNNLKKSVDQLFMNKADKTDVNAKIDKVNQSVSSVSDTVKANKTATDNALATKANAEDVTKSLNTKADKTDVDAKLATKANTSDVYVKKDVDDKLATKADKTAVSDSISKLQANVDTKANSADVSKQFESYTKTDDLNKELATKANQADVDAKINAIDFSKIKFRKQYDKGNFTPADKTWTATKQADGTYIVDLYHDDWTAQDLATIANELHSQHYTKAEIDGKVNTINKSISDVSASAKNATDIAKQLATKANTSDVSNLQNQVNQRLSTNDFNTFMSRSFFRKQGMNANGDLVEIRGNATRQSNGGYAFDVWSNDWTASKLKDAMNQISSLQSTVNSLKTQLNDAVNTINYLKANMLIGRHFNNETQAQSWYNANPNGIAFIDK